MHLSAARALFNHFTTLNMKKLLSIVVALAFLPGVAFAQLSTNAGGTGVVNVASGSILFGSVYNIRMATSTGLKWDNTNTRLTFTNGSSTAYTTTTLCLGTDCRTSWPGGSTAENVWTDISNLYIKPTTTIGMIVNASSTITGLTINANATTTGSMLILGSTTLQNFTGINSTTTNSTSTRGYFSTSASSTAFYTTLGKAAGSFLAVDPTGLIIATTTPSSGGTPGGANTDVQFNDSGAFGGGSQFTWDKNGYILSMGVENGTAEIISPNATTGNNNGGNIFMLGGNGIGSGTGGEAAVASGSGGATGNGGQTTLESGLGGATSGAGGDIDVAAGSAQAGNSNGGNVQLLSGDKTGGGINGQIQFWHNGISGAVLSSVFDPNANLNGFGTTSPFADLSVHANNGDTNRTLFAVGSSTANSTTTLFSISNTGIVKTNYATGCVLSTNGTLSVTGSGCNSGTVTSIAAGNGLLGGTITTTGTLSLASYLATSSAETSGQLAYWTSTNGTPATLGEVATGTVSAGSSAITVTAGRSVIGGALAIDCAAASGSHNGCLSSTDWTTFNGKGSGSVTSVGSGTGLTGGTITTTGTLSFAAIAANSLWVNNTNASAVPTVIATSSLFTFPWSIAKGGTNDTGFTTNQWIYSNGTALVSASSTFAGGPSGWYAIGTSTPLWGNLTLGSSTAPQLILTDNTAGNSLYAWRAVGNNLFLATSTNDTSTSTQNVFTINSNGFMGIGTSSPWSALTLTRGAITVQEVAPATSTAMTIDWKNGNQQIVDVGLSAIVIGFNNASSSGQNERVVVCNPAAGTPGAVSFSVAGLAWAGGTAPTPTATNKHCDVYSFITTAGTSSTPTSSPPVIFGTQVANF